MEKRGKIDLGKIWSDTEFIEKRASILGWTGPMFLRHPTYLSIFVDPSNGYGWISWISAEPPVIEEMRSLKNNETKIKLTAVSRDLEHFGNPKNEKLLKSLIFYAWKNTFANYILPKFLLLFVDHRWIFIYDKFHCSWWSLLEIYI